VGKGGALFLISTKTCPPTPPSDARHTALKLKMEAKEFSNLK